METFSFNEDHGNWGEYLDLKPVIADGKTNRGYWVRNMQNYEIKILLKICIQIVLKQKICSVDSITCERKIHSI